MKIKFENIGAVKEAQIDFTKNLNILCGPNNTGKTYIAYSVYGLSKLSFHRNEFPKNSWKDIAAIIETGKVNINLVAKFQEHKSVIQSKIEKRYKEEIPKIFGLDKDAADKIFPDTSVKVQINNDKEIIAALTEHQVAHKMGFGEEIVFELSKKKGEEILQIIMVVKDGKSPSISTDFFIEMLSEHVFEIIIRVFIPNSYIAPVERNSIYTFSKELSIQRNVLVDKILDLKSEKGKRNDPFDLLERRATRYPLPVRDGLEISEDIANFKKRESLCYRFADELEEKVLNGKITISKEGEVVFSPNKAKTAKLPIHLTASIVKSLSSLVLYFRHFARKGDFLIIDEPELNLHPDSQILIARIIARIVNEGFKVLINTHSDYIIRELNNLIMLSKITGEKKTEIFKEYSYSESEILNPENVGAYLFSYNGKSKVVSKDLTVTEDGFEVETIDTVINQLNERAQHLFFNLKSGSND